MGELAEAVVRAGTNMSAGARRNPETAVARDEERKSLLAQLDEEDDDLGEGGGALRAARDAGTTSAALASSSAAIATSKRALGDALRVVDGVASAVARDGDVLRGLYNRLRGLDEANAEAAAHLRVMEWTRLRRRAVVPCVLAAAAAALAVVVWLVVRRHR